MGRKEPLRHDNVVERRLRGLFWRAKFELRARRSKRYEPEIELLPALVDPKRAAIDIGANRGLYLSPLTRLSPRIHAFEPLEMLAERLRLAFPSVNVEQVALSDGEGTCELRMPGNNYSWATIEPRNRLELAQQAVSTMQVRMRTLDSYGLDEVGFIKIDVEGHEPAVIRGAIATLERSRPIVLVELEERHRPGAIAQAREQLATLDYTGYFRDEGSLRPIEQFESVRDQHIGNVSERGKVGRYINNFIFIPKQRRLAILGDLRRMGIDAVGLEGPQG